MLWYSILVNLFNFEGGAKNPPKGISMKFLVLACDAQSWVISGSKGMGAIRKGMRAMTLALWRLSWFYEMVETYVYKQVRSVACLEWNLADE